ncbi:glycosyltransferase family 52 [Psychrobacter arcticus]|nr:glycosyltransferase family 52 [Psychrobacter arcticus]
MNIFIVRTRLQALIVEKIIKIESKKLYVLVLCYQDHRYEDATEVYSLYEKVKRNSIFSISVLSIDNISINILKYLCLHVLSFITGGKIFLAGIDSYPFAISAKIFPFSKIITYDDGTANFISNSKYFKDTPLERKGIKGIISKVAFPEGAAKYLRSRTKLHYTIFSGLSNIVEEARLFNLNWDWGELLDERDLKKIPAQTNTILLGTVFHNLSKREYLQQKVLEIFPSIDLYIMHPRESVWIENVKAVRLHSPAEAILKHIVDRMGLKIKVYHFNSTVAYSLADNTDIEFIDLLVDE